MCCCRLIFVCNNLFLSHIFWLKTVADLHRFDPDPAFHLDEDPDLTSHFDADSDSTFQIIRIHANPDPQHWLKVLNNDGRRFLK
jgi:hypothetical protein